MTKSHHRGAPGPLGRIKNFLRTFWLESLAVAIALAGVFLMFFERAWLVALFEFAKNTPATLAGIAQSMFSQVTVTSVVAILMIIGGIAFTLWRVRVHFTRSRRWRSHTCPHCGGALQRVHRKPFDRFLGLFILPHSRRYRCRECGKSMLRHGRSHSHHDDEEGQTEAGE